MTTLFENAAIPVVEAVDAPATPKKRGWLPLLTVLFLISYALMTMLIVEQGETIESQRALIKELFRDSTELSAMKMKAQQTTAVAGQNPAAKTQSPAQYPSSQNASQTPSTQIPSAQAPTIQTPSSQAVPQRRAQSQSARQKPQFQMPSKPASDLMDDRRSLITI